MSARRHRPERVIGLEVWDVMVAAEPLYLVPHEQLPWAIADVVQQLQRGIARRKRGNQLPRLAIDCVALGGGAPLAAIATELERSGVRTRIYDDPLWIAEPGGRALLSRLGAPLPYAVLDVGQTSLKLSVEGERQRLIRPLNLVPLELDARDLSESALHRTRTLSFLAAALASAARVRGVVLGLPCEVTDDLTVAGCSYPWPAGDRSLVRELLQNAQLTNIPCLVLNDAELAAVTISLHNAKESTLVLTVGLGVGAAYISPP